MGISKHPDKFSAKRVVDYKIGTPLRTPGSVAYRIRSEYS